jgi:hypothetical protein
MPYLNKAALLKRSSQRTAIKQYEMEVVFVVLPSDHNLMDGFDFTSGS